MNVEYRFVCEEYPDHQVLGTGMLEPNAIFNIGGDGYAHPVDVRSDGGCDDAEGKRASIKLVTKTYFGFALADSMFNGHCTIVRDPLLVYQAKFLVARGVISCCNPSHQATIQAMEQRFGILVPIPSSPPQVSLEIGDSVIVMGVRGLPRLTDRHEYTSDEIEKAKFAFSRYMVVKQEAACIELSNQTEDIEVKT